MMPFVCHATILHKHCLQSLLGPFQLPRETEDNPCAKFWYVMLWYVIVFSVVVNCHTEKLQTKVWKFPLPH